MPEYLDSSSILGLGEAKALCSGPRASHSCTSSEEANNFYRSWQPRRTQLRGSRQLRTLAQHLECKRLRSILNSLTGVTSVCQRAQTPEISGYDSSPKSLVTESANPK
ncbi:hypothetical protein E4U58_000811, partial [Claviceps cyperi]